ARAPFLDHELAEFCFSLPGTLKLPEGKLKGLLKRYARGRIPDAIIDRPKMGFSFPFKEWLRKGLGASVESTLRSSRLFSEGWVDGPFCRRLLAEHRSGLVDHAPRLWMVYSLARWYDRWIG
ncbi:MAG: asparagine synthase-related protein, partial [Elusimicrobiota bacterium]